MTYRPGSESPEPPQDARPDLHLVAPKRRIRRTPKWLADSWIPEDCYGRGLIGHYLEREIRALRRSGWSERQLRASRHVLVRLAIKRSREQLRRPFEYRSQGPAEGTPRTVVRQLPRRRPACGIQRPRERRDGQSRRSSTSGSRDGPSELGDDPEPPRERHEAHHVDRGAGLDDLGALLSCYPPSVRCLIEALLPAEITAPLWHRLHEGPRP